MSERVPEAGPAPGTNGSTKSLCPPSVLEAIYGKVENKKAAYENSLRRCVGWHRRVCTSGCKRQLGPSGGTCWLSGARCIASCLTPSALPRPPAAADGGANTPTARTTRRMNTWQILCSMTATTSHARPRRLTVSGSRVRALKLPLRRRLQPHNE